MPATIDDLAADLRRFFAERFPIGGDAGPGSVMLVFDNLGRPLSPREFTGSGSDAAIALLSHQRAADLADQLPAPNALKQGWYLPGSGRLSRWYASMLASSTLAGDGVAAAEVAAFEAAKADALRALEHNKLVVVSGTGVSGAGAVPATGTFDTYYATSMSPLDWFTESATSWSRYEVGATGSSADAGAGTVTPAPAATPEPEFTLRVAPDPTAPELVDYLQYAIETEPPAPVEPDPRWRRGPIDLEPLIDPGRMRMLDRRVRTPVLEVVEDRGFPARFARIADLPEVELVAAWNDPAIDLPRQLVDNVGAALAAEQVVAAVDATVAAPVTSHSFAVSFEYTLVRLDRPWWDEIFLHRRDWRVSGYQPGQISNGSAQGDGGGPISLVTIGMLVIRDLTITASWSAADRAALASCTSLGPFCIAAGGFDSASGTLSRKGLQVVAWLVQVPPVLPPR